MPNNINTQVHSTAIRKYPGQAGNHSKYTTNTVLRSKHSYKPSRKKKRAPRMLRRNPVRTKQAYASAKDDALKPLGFGERMLRNTAVCIALLLCVLAVQGVDHPIAQTVSGQLHNWVTMDLDESLGSLKFVQNILPDAALVFWHIGDTEQFLDPSTATVAHAWHENEPWLVYAADEAVDVLASASGEVVGISYRSEDSATVRVKHTDGLETLYGNLANCSVREGDWVETSSILGTSAELYFEIRSEGRSMNPVPLMAEKP